MWEWLGVLALGAVLFWAVSGRVVAYTYGYDEADYLWIADKGIVAHWMESPSLTLSEFVRLGTSRGQDAAGRKQLSEMVRRNGYVDFYRHWHGPLYFYWLIASGTAALEGERQGRALQMVFLAAVFVVIYWGVRRLWGLPAAVLCATASVISYANVQTSLQLIPHTLFTLCYTASLLLVAMWMHSGRFGYWYAAVVAAALAFTTLEVALVLILTLAVCAWLGREQWMAGWERRAWLRFSGRSMGLFAAVVLVVWPAAVVKLSFVKAYAFMAYLALFRKAAWGGESVVGSWLKRIESSPVEWMLFAAGVVYVVWKRKQALLLAPFAVYVLLMMAAVGKVAADETMFLIPRYQAPYLTGLLLLGCLGAMSLVAGRGKSAEWAVAGLLMAMLGWNSWRQFEANPVPSYFPWSQAIETLKQKRAGLAGKTVLAPQGILPVMRHYLPAIEWRPYADTIAPEELPAAVAGEKAEGAVWMELKGLKPAGGESIELSRAYSGERIAYYGFGSVP